MLEIIFSFLVAVKWPLTILIIIFILHRSFKKFKRDVIKATAEKLIDDKNKDDYNES